jgi:hypothetical protein
MDGMGEREADGGREKRRDGRRRAEMIKMEERY